MAKSFNIFKVMITILLFKFFIATSIASGLVIISFSAGLDSDNYFHTLVCNISLNKKNTFTHLR